MGFRQVVTVLVLLCVLPFAHATGTMHGLPLLRQFDASQLPASPTYPGMAADRAGNLYAASGEGVMLFRSGVWELLEASGEFPVYSIMRARDGSIYVAGAGVFGQLQRRDDGTHRFVDLLPRLVNAGLVRAPVEVYSLGETSRGIHAVSAGALFVLEKDGSTTRQQLPAGARSRPLVAGDAVYFRVPGEGLYRVDNAAMALVDGTQSLAQLRVPAAWTYRDGLLFAAADGFHFSDGKRLRKLVTEADAAFRLHEPYSGIALADGGFAVGSFDGTIMRFSPDLRLLDSFAASAGEMHDLVEDSEGAVWVSGENGIARLHWSLPWTRYDRLHGLRGRIFDSTWHDGRLWIAGIGVWSAQPSAEGTPMFSQLQWPGRDLETFALEGTDAGLLIGDRYGLAVLDRGHAQPRRLLDPMLGDSVSRLLPSAFNPGRVLAVSSSRIIVLGQRNGRWQVMAQWQTGANQIDGLYEVAAGEVWAGDFGGGVHRWRFDPESGRLLAEQRYGVAQGVPDMPGQATHLFRSDGMLYAISGQQVRRLQEDRFVAAKLPVLAGLQALGELEGEDNAKGSFAWTSRQLWWRKPGADAFQLQQIGDSRVPGFMAVALHGDGQLRVVTRDSVLQLDPASAQSPMALPQARLDRIELQRPDQPSTLLPLSPQTVQMLPAGAGLALRFGVQGMEPEVEFRYRMPGYHDEWSPWAIGRELTYQRLPAGAYTFQLQARVLRGTPTEVMSYSLQVAPFWHQRGWVRAFFGLVALLFVVVVVRLRNRGLNAQNRLLEQKISDRTAELQHANSQLSALAVTDGLTGIANRHAMEKALPRAWQRCAERQEPLAVMMIDVDHFKQFNDTHGHHVGDLQLCRVAQTLAAQVTDSEELLARYGGEEFVLILPDCDEQMALARGERLRSAVEQVTGAAGQRVTISVGVAVCVPVSDEDPMGLVRCADRALYHGKRDGRNRVRGASAKGKLSGECLEYPT
ncbi:ligand-binding sensor domain-containing diguanylate cyclase [Stenotrophomonas humi]|uniref:ligand-binding sensor domain-containing diguanylate cyclase n=1 Tax=Stenotrophomonas humi TaxID=405444 RepID=UPI000709D330|nr:diguanylate cyclase [Stenotrophomonas humi]